MSKYMEEFFGSYSEDDLEAGRKALAGGGVGKGKSFIIVEEKDATFTDHTGKQFIDCTSQAWSLNIGGCRQEIIDVVSEQIKHATHVRSGYGTIPKYLLTKRLSKIAPGNLKKVGYVMHGSVANEGALKLAMRNNPSGIYFLSPWRGFFGRTLATMSLTWPHPNNKFLTFMGNTVRFPNAYCYRCPFQQTYPGCDLACADFLRKLIVNSVDGKPIALIMEPFQAAGGMINHPREYLQAVREICDEFGIYLIWDEIQTGFGRMGRMFASDLYQVTPDILTFGKAVGGGFPLAGTLHREDMEDFGPQDHGFTFAHFPVSMAAGIVTLDILKKEDLPGRAQRMGEIYLEGLNNLQEKYPLIGDIRGTGLMIGIEFVKDRQTKEPAIEETGQFIEETFKRGVLFGRSTYLEMSNVVKIKPPLVITEDQVAQSLDVFEKVLKVIG
jgi:4-aminobutyrate aminotransferase/4-aminobutyrate aminotransferase/(S)-3-amino-2-methylpropionate transaminase